MACKPGKSKAGRIGNGGKSHHSQVMPTLIRERSKQKRRLTVVDDYDMSADAKKRIGLRNAKMKYFHIKTFSNGGFQFR
jgi:hypothetical protein